MQGKTLLRKTHFIPSFDFNLLKKENIISNFLNSKLNSIINYSC
jgi:hypothetical protein